MNCNVCRAALAESIYRSPRAVSITSLCEVLPRSTEVFFCGACGHIQTPALPDLAEYYDEDYKILVESEDEDQLYEIGPAGKVYRADHQLHTLLEKVEVAQHAKVLDYGCGKGSTLRRLTQLRPDIQPHLFDVSRMYVRFWERFALPKNWATHHAPESWNARFDLITSFYSLEHVVDLAATVATMRNLLREGGTLYAIVPDTFQNVGDFVVADHCNHFTAASIARLFTDAGLTVRSIDTTAHQSALVVVAERTVDLASTGLDRNERDELTTKTHEIAAFWRGYAAKVHAFEEVHGARGPAAIYGSGFYGTFLATCLERLDRVVAFVDQNPYRQGSMLLEKPIVAPDDLPAEVRVVYVGLNPRIARAEIAKLANWNSRRLEIFYP